MTVPIWVTLLLTVGKRRGWILFNKTCQACIKLPLTNDFQCLCLVWFPWIVAQTLLAFQCQHCSNGMLCLVTLMKRIVILDETAITWSFQSIGLHWIFGHIHSPWSFRLWSTGCWHVGFWHLFFQQISSSWQSADFKVETLSGEHPGIHTGKVSLAEHPFADQ